MKKQIIMAMEAAKALGPKSDKKEFVAVLTNLKTLRHRTFLKIGKLVSRIDNVEHELQESEELYEKFHTKDSKSRLNLDSELFNSAYAEKTRLMKIKSDLSAMITKVFDMYDRAIEYRLKSGVPTAAQELAADCGNVSQVKVYTIGGQVQ